MKKSVLSLLTGAALLGTVGVASAAEPMVLTNAAMDGITAGIDIDTSQSAAIVQIDQRSLVNIANTVQVQVVAVLSDVDVRCRHLSPCGSLDTAGPVLCTGPTRCTSTTASFAEKLFAPRTTGFGTFEYCFLPPSWRRLCRHRWPFLLRTSDR